MNRFSSSIGARLLWAFAVILAIMTAMTTIAVLRLQSAHETARYLVENKLATQQLASEWLGEVTLNGTRAVSIAKSDSLELADFFDARLKQGDALILDIGKQMRAQALDRDEEALVDAIDPMRAAYQEARAQVFKLKNSGRTPEAEQLFAAQMEPRFEQYRLAIRKLLDHQTRAAAAISAASVDAYTSSLMLLVGLGALSVVLGLLLALWLRRGIVAPLQLAVDLAARIAQGDLSDALAVSRATDETGKLLHALNAMKLSLARIVGQVRAGTDAIAASSVEIADGNLALSARTQGQAASLEQTSAAMVQLAAMVRDNAQDASRANALVDIASAVGGARRGSDVAGDDDDGDDPAVVGAGSRYRRHHRRDCAADQYPRAECRGRGGTGRRAGPRLRRGRQRGACAGAALGGGGARDQVAGGDSIGQVENGSAFVRQAGATMEEIMSGVGQVSTIVSRIAAASHEQSEGVAQANIAVGQIDQATQQNAALVEQAAAAAGSLQAEAASLARTVSQFTLSSAGTAVAMVEGGASGMRRAIPRLRHR